MLFSCIFLLLCCSFIVHISIFLLSLSLCVDLCTNSLHTTSTQLLFNLNTKREKFYLCNNTNTEPPYQQYTERNIKVQIERWAESALSILLLHFERFSQFIASGTKYSQEMSAYSHIIIIIASFIEFSIKLSNVMELCSIVWCNCQLH